MELEGKIIDKWSKEVGKYQTWIGHAIVEVWEDLMKIDFDKSTKWLWKMWDIWDTIKFEIKIKAKEYNGAYYNNVNVTRLNVTQVEMLDDNPF